MKKELLDFSRLNHFIAFEEGAYTEDNQDPNTLGHPTGSYLWTLMAERQNPSLILQSLRSLDQALSELARSAREESAFAEKELLPNIYRQGLYSLPFEVMEYIFGLISDEGCVDFGPFMLVNRYFRDIVRKIPCLWMRVFDSKDPRIYLERSGSRGLLISMSRLVKTGSQFDRSLDALAPQWKRWRSLSIKVGNPYKPAGDSMSDLKNRTIARLRRLRYGFNGRTFPALETLKVCYHSLWAFEALNADIQTFFSSWDMPALRCVSAVGFVPDLSPACNLDITRFQLKVWHSCHVNAVGDALRLLRSLEEFSLEVSYRGWWTGGAEVKPVALPRLRVLKISTIHTHPQLIAPLINALDAPNLREVKADVTVDVEDTQNASDLLAFLEHRPFWTQLETLHCSIAIPIVPECKWRYHAPDFVMPRLPSPLQHLTLEGWRLYPSTESICYAFDGRALPLRILRFRNCDRIDTAYIRDLESVIFAPCFETLEIINCPNINTDELRTVIPKGKKLRCEG